MDPTALSRQPLTEGGKRQQSSTSVSQSGCLAALCGELQHAMLSDSSPDRIRSAHLLSPLLVPRLLLSALITHDALVGSVASPRLTASCRPWLRLRHAPLTAMLAALILHTFQIVFSGHCNHTLFHSVFPMSRLKLSALIPWQTMRSRAVGFQGMRILR